MAAYSSDLEMRAILGGSQFFFAYFPGITWGETIGVVHLLAGSEKAFLQQKW